MSPPHRQVTPQKSACHGCRIRRSSRRSLQRAHLMGLGPIFQYPLKPSRLHQLPTQMACASHHICGMPRSEESPFVHVVLLKVLATKADSYLMPPSQIEQVTTYLKTYEADFARNAQTALSKIQLGGRDKESVSAVETYAQSAHKLLTPVNIWMIPYPTGHAAVFASSNKLSLVATNT